MAELSSATLDEIAEELNRRKDLTFLLLARREGGPPDGPEEEREAVYLSGSFIERPLTMIHWALETVTSMLASIMTPEGNEGHSERCSMNSTPTASQGQPGGCGGWGYPRP
jgi:hypothetical protein